jgi:hypothetical protein
VWGKMQCVFIVARQLSFVWSIRIINVAERKTFFENVACFKTMRNRRFNYLLKYINDDDHQWL